MLCWLPEDKEIDLLTLMLSTFYSNGHMVPETTLKQLQTLVGKLVHASNVCDTPNKPQIIWVKRLLNIFRGRSPSQESQTHTQGMHIISASTTNGPKKIHVKCESGDFCTMLFCIPSHRFNFLCLECELLGRADGAEL